MKQHITHLSLAVVLFAIVTNITGCSNYSDSGVKGDIMTNVGMTSYDHRDDLSYDSNNSSKLSEVCSKSNVDDYTESYSQRGKVTENIAAMHLESKSVSPDDITEFGTEEIKLIIDSGAVQTATEISINVLNSENIPHVPEQMQNLTKDVHGYRLLPDGQQFDKDITLAISYDSSQIPFGYTAQDIYTYFYNEQTKQWQQIERDSVDEINQIVYSRTNHFTDYINGILKVPESSDAMAYTPTSIKDLEAVHPLDGLTLMSPPEANNRGTANLVYPIQLPAGRNGMQPNINLTYNSSGGSGWLGLGWDLGVSCISVETRWGVPLYDSTNETETYLLDGETLVTSYYDDEGMFRLHKPAYHREPESRMDLDQDGEPDEDADRRRFYTRVEGAFRKIIRHGNSPKTYWWEVTDKNGTRYFYGSSDGNVMDPSGVFRKYHNKASNIAKWYLTKVVDKYGNTITYNYQTVNRDNIYQKVLNDIQYTGNINDNDAGKYRVLFKTVDKTDKSTSYRNGFKESDAKLLDKIQVLYDSDTIREYYFGYNVGEFDKTLLCSVFEGFEDSAKYQRYEPDPQIQKRVWDSLINILNFHPYNRCDFETKDMIYFHLMYSFDYNQMSDSLLGPFTSFFYEDNDDPDLSPYYFLNVNEQSNINATNSYSWNLGGGVDVGVGFNYAMKSLTAGGNYNYVRENSEGLVTFTDLNGDGYPDKLIRGDGTLMYRLNNYSENNNNVVLFGELTDLSDRQSFQHHSSSTDNWGVEGQLPFLSASGNWSDSRNSTYVYIADADADGLIDIIDNGRVYLNRLDEDGIPTFSDFTDDTQIPVFGGCEDDFITNDEVVDTSLFSSGWKYFERDTCIISTERINERVWFPITDSVLVVTGKDSVWELTVWYKDTVMNNVHTSVDTCWTIVDSLYYEYPERYEPNIDLVKVWEAPYSGIVNIVGRASLLTDFEALGINSNVCDGVWLTIQKSEEDEHALSRVITPSNPEINMNLNNLTVNKGDKLYFRMNSVNRRDYDMVSWNPTIRYTTAYNPLKPTISYAQDELNQTDANGDSIFVFNYGRDFSLSEQQKVGAPFDSRFRIEAHITSNNTILQDDLHFIVRKHNETRDSLHFQYDPNIFSVLTGCDEDDIDTNSFDVLNSTESTTILQTFTFPKGTVLDTTVTLHVNMSKDYTNVYPLMSDSVSCFSGSGLRQINGNQSLSFSLKPHSFYNQLRWQDFNANVTVIIDSSYDDNFNRGSIYNSTEDKYNFVFHPAVLKESFDYMAVPGMTFIPSDTMDNIKVRFSTPAVPCIMTIKDDAGLVVCDSMKNTFNSLSGVSLAAGKKYYIDLYYKYHSNISTNEVTLSSGGQTATVEAGIYTNYYEDEYKLYGTMYRNWGQFGYKVNNASDSIIIEDSLYISDILLDTTDILPNTMDTAFFYNMPDNPESSVDGFYNPLLDKCFIMNVNTEFNSWVGYGNIIYASKDTSGLTKIGQMNSNNTTAVDYTISPIPPATGNVVAVNKLNLNEGTSWSVSVSPSVSLSISHNKGNNTLLSDYMDMNGDGYPDILSEAAIQYSKPTGGLSNRVVNQSIKGINKTEYSSSGATIGASYFITEKEPANNAKTAKSKIDVPFSCGHGETYGTDVTVMTLMDINGDGLPDRIYNDGDEMKVMYNCGYGWAGGTFDINEIMVSSSASDGNNISIGNVNIGNTSITGGLGENSHNNTSEYSMIDINGDGLPDAVTGNRVRFNTGSGFTSYARILGTNVTDKSVSSSVDGSAAVSIGIPLWPFVKLIVNPKGGMSWSKSETESQWIDMNNDGYPDYVTKEGVRYSTIGSVNLLNHVSTIFGSEYWISYKLSEDGSYDCPQRYWNMDSLVVYDGYTGDGDDTMRYAFEYRNRKYDRYERKDYGYDSVTTKEYLEGELYRVTTTRYHNDNYLYEGLSHYNVVSDAEGNKYVENHYLYVPAEITSGEFIDSETPAQCIGDVYPVLKHEKTLYYEGDSVPGIQTDRYYTYTEYGNVSSFTDAGSSNYAPEEMDVEYWDSEVTAYADDDIISEMEYSYDTVRYIVSQVGRVSLISQYDGDTLRQRSALYDSLGSLIRLSVKINDTANSIYDYTYDTYGNITSAKLPPNNNGQRMVISYTYDSIVHTYPVKTRNSFGYQSTATYDYKWGKPLVVTDISGNSMAYTYDSRGRLKTLTGPKEIASNRPYTIKYDYWDLRKYPVAFGAGLIPGYRQIKAILYSTTSHYDPGRPGNDINTLTNADGLGRVIQIRKDIEENGVERSLVSGRIEYDALGRATAEYHPVTVDTSYVDEGYIYIGAMGYVDFAPIDSVGDVRPQTTTYDIMDRPLVVTYSDSTSSSYLYGMEEDYNDMERFKTTMTDQNGHSTKIYTDHRQLQTQITNAIGGTTRFTYDALGQLLQSKDPEDFTTTHTYDKGGRRLSRTHPSNGTTTWAYDPAGNITMQKMSSGEKINYYYDYNRLNNIEYSDRPWNNVYYVYGDSTAGNSAGRVTRMQDATGVQEFEYDQMGNVTFNRHTYVLPNTDRTITLSTEWDYDSWGRVCLILYPDEEKVIYEYGAGGKLKRVWGRKELSSGNNNSGGIIVGLTPSVNPPNTVSDYYYLDSIMYDKYEQRIREINGDGVETHYIYDNETRRLVKLRNFSHNDTIFLQDNYYEYDNVGNITLIKDEGLNQRKQHYTYDSINRLVRSNGEWYDGHNTISYENVLKYTPSGRMEVKYMNSTRLNNIHGLHTVKYENKYIYDNNTNPFAVKEIEDVMSGVFDSCDWDAKGNMISHFDGRTNRERSLCWTEDNRLQAFMETEGASAYYNYDANGERNLKFTGRTTSIYQNGNDYQRPVLIEPTLYASSFITITPKGYTKHIFEEGKRVCSKIGGGFAHMTSSELDSQVLKVKHDYGEQVYLQKEGIVNSFNMCMSVDPEVLDEVNLYKIVDNLLGEDNAEPAFYYHGDHLGSASYVTASNGEVVQTLNYLPYGEDWVDLQHFNVDPQAYNLGVYKFNGKEKDFETGYHYYGARYYDSEKINWLSVDRFADKYPSLSPYSYCANNPVSLIDINGDSLWIQGRKERILYEPNKNYGGNDVFIKKAFNSLNEINSVDKGRELITELHNSDNNFTILEGERSMFTTTKTLNAYVKTKLQIGDADFQEMLNRGIVTLSGSGGEIQWNPSGQALPTEDGYQTYPTTDLGHELFHALDANRGLLDDRKYQKIYMSEWQAAYKENVLRKCLGLPYRVSYGGVRMLDDKNMPIHPDAVKAKLENK